ncbi:MAG: DUF167 domain-containing protein [Sphingomonadales bacterium]|jgi:uncharacterized protein (TIGR00251 family)
MRIALRVIPKAGSDKIDGPVETVDGQRLKVRVCAAAEAGRANKAVIALLAKSWGVPKSALEITHGETSRNKLLLVHEQREKVEDWLSTRGWVF